MRYTFILLSLSLCFSLKAQQNIKSELAFSEHLFKNQLYKDNEILLREISNTQDYEDSIFYLRARNFLKLNSADSAFFYLQKPKSSNNTELKICSFLLENFIALNNFRKYDFAYDEISKVKENETGSKTHNWFYQLKSSALLARKITKFDSLSKFDNAYSGHYNFLHDHLYELRQSIDEYKIKSPLLAGVLSAVVPGSGKWYAGSFKKGITAFLTNSFLGWQAFENYKKAGPKSARFIIFGSLFSVFYIGNIWGSVLEVKINQQYFNESINHQITMDLSIPISDLL